MKLFNIAKTAPKVKVSAPGSWTVKLNINGDKQDQRFYPFSAHSFSESVYCLCGDFRKKHPRATQKCNQKIDKCENSCQRTNLILFEASLQMPAY